MEISVSVADMLVQIYLYRYRQKYLLEEYICIGIGIGWTHIGQTLVNLEKGKTLLFKQIVSLTNHSLNAVFWKQNVIAECNKLLIQRSCYVSPP